MTNVGQMYGVDQAKHEICSFHSTFCSTQFWRKFWTDQRKYYIYKLKVVEDVTLERGSTNFNYLQYLITSFHPGFPKKCSLLRFENVPSGCKSVNYATMFLYYLYSHKASYMSDAQVPFITRTILAHRVLKPWRESQATSTKRDAYN